MKTLGIDDLVDINLAPDYETRKQAHTEYRDKARSLRRAETWPVRGLKFDLGLTLSTQPEPIVVNGITLEGMEVVIYNQITALLAEKEKDHPNSPIVVLDFGGMYGLPFIRLAKATEDLVRQSKVVYAVSNLTFNPAEMSEEAVRGITGLAHSEYNDFFLQNRGLVHFIVSDAEELKEIKLGLPNGKYLSLYGNIDLIHEKDALGKSQLLDSDLPTLGKSLSDYGTLLLGDKEARLTANPRAFGIGEENLLNTRVQKIDIGREAKYAVYVKPNAPKLTNSSEGY